MSLQAPVMASKTLGPSQELEFMGIVLESIRMEARLPDDKLNRARDSSIPVPSDVLSAYLNCNLLLAPSSLRAKSWSQGEPPFKG